MATPDPSALDRLRTADWGDLSPRLLLAAQRLHAQYLRRLPGAPEPADLVQDALADLMTGRRACPPDVPILTVIFHVMRSKATNLLTTNRAVGTEAGGPRHIALDDAPALATPIAPATGVVRDAIRQRVADDPELARMVDLWLEDPKLKPGDLAAMLEVPVRDIYNARKRLARKLADLREEA